MNLKRESVLPWVSLRLNISVGEDLYNGFSLGLNWGIVGGSIGQAKAEESGE